MSQGSKDNIFDLTKYLDEQKLKYVLAIWLPIPKNDKIDSVSVYTSFDKLEMKKLSEVLKNASVDEEYKNANKDKV